MISLRRATVDDAERLLAWANDPATRAAGFRTSPIDRRTHGLWLRQRLASFTTRLYVGLDGEEPVGQVRLEADPDGRVEVGISVAHEARGRGIGRLLLDAGLEAGTTDPDLQAGAFVARIRPENAASIALFEGAGFRRIATDEVAGIACLVYERAAG